MKYLLGIDLGTSGVKTVLFNQNGQIIDQESLQYPLFQDEDGYAEQEPHSWWEKTKETIKTVANRNKDLKAQIVGLGVSGQMHGLVILDEQYKPIRRSIIWCDSRSSLECKTLEKEIGVDRLLSITGNRALPAFTASKILWIKNNEPEVFKKIRHICLPKDYINFCLTSKFTCEVSDASGTQLMDIKRKKWSKDILNLLEIKEEMLGTILESSQRIGRINKDVANELGLSIDLIVAAGAGDQAASAVGNNITIPGQVSCSLGSSGVVFAPLKTLQIDKDGKVQTFMHAIKDSYFVMGVTQGCGISMSWSTKLLYGHEKDKYELMSKELENTKIGANGILFLPYLMGERTPHLDPNARGTFIGISANTMRKDLARSVMEGISYSLLDCLKLIKNYQSNIQEVYLSGGGAKNPFWCQMLSDVFNCTCKLTNSSESGALGVAILASVAANIYENIQTACSKMIKTTKTYTKTETRHDTYMKYYSLYQDAYKDLKNLFKRMREV